MQGNRFRNGETADGVVERRGKALTGYEFSGYTHGGIDGFVDVNVRLCHRAVRDFSTNRSDFVAGDRKAL